MIIREIQDFSLSRIADSGQCFRMNRLESGAYRIIAFGRYLEANDLGDSRFAFSCTEEEFQDIWTDYFDLKSDYRALISLVPPDDTFLQAAIKYGQGMRILNQDPWEVMVSFIISQRKSIPAIKTAIETMCVHFGTPMAFEGKPYFSFPSARHIAGLSCRDIACCSLGYRDKYVTAAAESVARGDIRFEDLMDADETTAGTVLKTIPGIGEKVANCILLFGLHKSNAFPEDTWIKRIIDAEYAGEFPKGLYEGHLGIIQQYIFYYARSREYQTTAACCNL
ncbi:MAG: DNA glycosylase [Eubacteriales bacterium]